MRSLSHISIVVFLFCLWVVLMTKDRHSDHARIDLTTLKTNTGDHESWSHPQFDDQPWPSYLDKNGTEKTWWMRFDAIIDKQVEANKKMGLLISVSGAHNVFFDGHLLGSNGNVDSLPTLDVVKYQKLYFIPDSLTDIGTHKIALRIASNDSPKNFKVAIGDYIDLARDPLIWSVFIHILAGIFLTLSIIFFFQAYSQQFRWDLILFSLLSLILLFLLVLEYVKFYYDYSYQFQLFRIISIEYLTFLIAMLTPLYLLVHFKYKYIYWIIGAECLLLIGILQLTDGYDLHARYLILICSLFSLGIALFALIKNTQKGSLPLLICILCIMLSFFLQYDITLFLGYGMLLSSIAFDYLSKSLDEQQQYQMALLRSKRLEVELLKSKIQPHFLLNTLTSLIDVIEEDPQEATAFIHTLADLSQIIHEISSESCIPIQKELALCQAHLKVMSFRKGVHYSLRTDNLNLSETVPPAIFLTVVENGLSHNKPVNGEMSFTISYAENHLSKTYTIVSSGIVRNHRHIVKDGIGNKYIKARLDEFCGEENWSFSSSKDAQAWRTEIHIHNPPPT